MYKNLCIPKWEVQTPKWLFTLANHHLWIREQNTSCLCSLNYIFQQARSPPLADFSAPVPNDGDLAKDISVSDVDVCMQFTWKITVARQITDGCKK